MKSKAVIPSLLRILLVLIILLMRVGGDFSTYDDLRPHFEATDPSGCDADDDKRRLVSVDFEPFRFLYVPPSEQSFAHLIEKTRTFAFTPVVRLIPRAPPV